MTADTTLLLLLQLLLLMMTMLRPTFVWISLGKFCNILAMEFMSLYHCSPPRHPSRKKTLAKTISFSEPTKPETGGCQTDWINKKPSTTLVQCCVMISLTSMPGNMNLGTGNSHPHASQSARVGRRHMAYVWCLHLIMTMTKKSPEKKSIGKEMAITKKTTNLENWQRTTIWETFWQTYWILKLSHSHYPTMTLRFIAQFKWGFMTDFSTFFFVIWQSILMVDCGRNWVCSIERFRWNR